MKDLIKKINDYLEETFKDNPERLNHIYSVRDKALELGLIYHADLDCLEVAALLHDATKGDDPDDVFRLIESDFSKEEISEIPIGCLHAYSATMLAKNKFKITNVDILNAITYHCSGREKMSLLEQIIYVSDFIEDSRTFVEDQLRALAKNDIDQATYEIMRMTVEYLENHERPVSTMTHKGLIYYHKKIGGNE